MVTVRASVRIRDEDLIYDILLRQDMLPYRFINNFHTSDSNNFTGIHVHDKGASGWLNVLPLEDEGFSLNKE